MSPIRSVHAPPNHAVLCYVTSIPAIHINLAGYRLPLSAGPKWWVRLFLLGMLFALTWNLTNHSTISSNQLRICRPMTWSIEQGTCRQNPARLVCWVLLVVGTVRCANKQHRLLAIGTSKALRKAGSSDPSSRAAAASDQFTWGSTWLWSTSGDALDTQPIQSSYDVSNRGKVTWSAHMRLVQSKGRRSNMHIMMTSKGIAQCVANQSSAFAQTCRVARSSSYL